MIKKTHKEELNKAFTSLPKKKGLTTSNPPALQSSPFVTKKPTKNK